jgi:uncharacterized membrane protein AbrB (regulator of aidB expression)
MTPEQILKLKLLPRFMMFCVTLMAWNVTSWFMELGITATTQQTAFVSTICGCFSGMFAVWLNHEGKK